MELRLGQEALAALFLVSMDVAAGVGAFGPPALVDRFRQQRDDLVGHRRGVGHVGDQLGDVGSLYVPDLALAERRQHGAVPQLSGALVAEQRGLFLILAWSLM